MTDGKVSEKAEDLKEKITGDDGSEGDSVAEKVQHKVKDFIEDAKEKISGNR